MSGAELVTVAFLAVSLVSLIVQAWAMRRLHRTRVRDGVYRTALCRVGCAVIYVAVGANALVWHWATLQTTFSAFCITQGTWQANAWLDVRARAHHAGRHRLGFLPPQPSRERAHDLRTLGVPVTTALQFADISSNNPIPDLHAYVAAGHRHLCRKVSEGTGYHWIEGDAVADQAHALGLKVGHYHWLRPDSDPVAQARFFIGHVDMHLREGDWLMTDFERTASAADPDDQTRAAQLRAFNATVRAELPTTPLYVYTGNWYLDGKPAMQAECRRWPIVMSNYSAVPTLPNPYGLRYVAWQFTDAATVAGFSAPVDYNRWLTTQSAPATSGATPLQDEEDEMKRFRFYRCGNKIYVGDGMFVRYLTPAAFKWEQAFVKNGGGDTKVRPVTRITDYGTLLPAQIGATP